MVGPTNVQPRFFRSLEIAVEVGVKACHSVGGPSKVACGHMYSAIDPNSSISSNARGRVVDGRADLALVSDDAGIVEQAVDVVLVEVGDEPRVEAGEGSTEVFALAQDGQPRQAGLEALEAQLFEQAMIVGNAEAPFGVVIGEVVRGRGSPATDVLVVTCNQICHGRHRGIPDRHQATHKVRHMTPLPSYRDLPKVNDLPASWGLLGSGGPDYSVAST